MRHPFRSLALGLALVGGGVSTERACGQFGFDTLEPADGDKIVSMDLLTADGTITPGTTELVGVRLRIQPGWHVYWRNPGDSGDLPRIRIDAPLGISVGEIQWPRPVVFESHDETTYGYADEVVLLVPITMAADMPAASLSLPLEASWLVCKRACLMGDAKGSVSFRVRPADDNGLRLREDALADARKRLPTPIGKFEGVTARIEAIAAPTVDPERRLVITGPANDDARVRFIPDLTPGVTSGKGHPIDATVRDGRFRIEVPLTVEPDNSLGKPLEVAGLVIFGPLATDPAISVRLPIETN